MTRPVSPDDCSTHGRCDLEFVRLVSGAMTFTKIHSITERPPAHGQTTNDPWYVGYIFAKNGERYTVASCAPDYNWYEQRYD